MKRFKFARRCDATNNGINEGFCFGDGEMYFSTRAHLLEHLRTIEWVNCKGKLSTDCNDDEELLDFFFDEEMYYHTQWEELDDDEWYESEHLDGRGAVLVSAYDSLKIRFESYTDEELQTFNGDNEETLKSWNRIDAIEEAIRSCIEEQNN